MIGEPTYQVTARLNADGEATVRVTASVEYGNRQASFSEEVTDEKTTSAVAAAMKKALTADVKQSASQQATRGAMQGYIIAVEKGEDLTGDTAEAAPAKKSAKEDN